MKRQTAVYYFILMGLLTTILFQNCSRDDFTVLEQTSLSESPNDSSKLNTCESILFNEFLKPNGYHAFLTTNCGSCHNGLGQGPGFASSNTFTAWEKFVDKEVNSDHRISERAISDHQPGVTGLHHKAMVDRLKEEFAVSQIKFETCEDELGQDDPKVIFKPLTTTALSLSFLKPDGEAITDTEKLFLRSETLKYYVEEKPGTAIYLEKLQVINDLNPYERPVYDVATNSWKKTTLKKVSSLELNDEEKAHIRIETYKLFDAGGKPIMENGVQKEKSYFLNPFQRIKRNPNTNAILVDPKTFEPLVEELARGGQYAFSLKNGQYTADIAGDEPYVTFKIEIFRSQRPITKTEQRVSIRKRVNDTTIQTLTVVRPTAYNQVLDPYVVIQRPSLFMDANIPNSLFPKYAYQLQELSIILNSVKQTDRTIFKILNSVVCEKTPINVMVNSNSEILPLDFSKSPSIQFEFKHVDMIERSLFPDLKLACSEDEKLNEDVILPAKVSYNDLMGSTDINVFKKSCISCHSSSNLAGGFDISIYDRAKDKNTKIIERMNNANSPMPPSGILNPTSRKLVEKWVGLGSPQN
jgi:hypothetical protein